MKLEVGKFYYSRNGRKAKLVSKEEFRQLFPQSIDRYDVSPFVAVYENPAGAKTYCNIDEIGHSFSGWSEKSDLVKPFPNILNA